MIKFESFCSCESSTTLWIVNFLSDILRFYTSNFTKPDKCLFNLEYISRDLRELPRSPIEMESCDWL